MFINFINPMYPAQDMMSGSCNFKVIVSNPSVCQVRNLDEAQVLGNQLERPTAQPFLIPLAKLAGR